MNWMITHSGKRIDLPSPKPGQVDIKDVAVQLSRMPRFVGATQQPWNVAAHSLHCAALAEGEGASLPAQLAALLHDAHEAYMGDIPSPFKAAVRLEANSPIWCHLDLAEEKLQVAVLHQLGALAHFEAHSSAVKRWDLISLATERKYLMHPAAMDAPWPMLKGIEPAAWPLTGMRGMGWVDWAEDFEERYHTLVAAIYFTSTTNPETTTA